MAEATARTRPPDVDHERQWRLNCQNFQGRWVAAQRWFKVPEGAQPGAINWSSPEVSDESIYHIYFSDEDHGVWHGMGLRFAAGGEKKLDISLATYNNTGICWQFDGFGCQVSASTTKDSIVWEANFFGDGKSRRSMLIVMMKPDSNGEFVLAQVGEACFRNSLVPEVNAVDDNVRSVEDLLAGLPEAGRYQCRSHVTGLEEVWAPLQAADSLALRYFREGTVDRTVKSFRDGLMISYPIRVALGASCDCAVACRSASRLDLVVASYTEDGVLTSMRYEQYDISK